MQTNFTPEQLADPDIKVANEILRACVHCGFCTATCPTYVLRGDELDSPRGRIYLIKDMLEKNRPAPATVVKHVDRCLSCLSCMTTCPSGVHYMHLVDLGRAHIEKTYRRPLGEQPPVDAVRVRSAVRVGGRAECLPLGHPSRRVDPRLERRIRGTTLKVGNGLRRQGQPSVVPYYCCVAVDEIRVD